MKEMPDGYAALQKSWSVGRSKSVEDAARRRVQFALKQVRKFAPDAETSVLVLGPQHGFELDEFFEAGFAVMGVDIVPMFVEDCRKRGLFCAECAVENMSAGAGIIQRWNIYASHVLEHCYDVEEAVRQIELVCDQWCFVAVPIEPDSENRGHCSPIRSRQHLDTLFPADKWNRVFHVFHHRPQCGDGHGNIEALYVRLFSPG